MRRAVTALVLLGVGTAFWFPVSSRADRLTAEALSPRIQARIGRGKARTLNLLQAIEKSNVPIDFWGKVVNQNQQPIEGVNVRYSYSTEHSNIVGAAWGEQRIHKSDASTDAAGMFVLTGIKGHTLSIESLTKEG